MCSLFQSFALGQPNFLSLRVGSRTVVGCFLSQVFQAVPALFLVAKQRPVEMAAQNATSSLFSPSTKEETERENLTVSNTVQVLDFEDERYAATITMSQQLERIPLPKVATKARPKGRPRAPNGESQLEHLAKNQGDAKEESCAETSKVSSDAVASEVLRRGAGDQRKRAVLKRCKAKTRAKHYGKPDERVMFSALEKAMGRKYAAYEPPKRSLWDHLECHRQACVAGVEAPRLVSFNPAEAWVEEYNEGSSTIIIHGEKMMVTTVSKTAEYGTSAAALSGSDKAFRYTLPEPPKVRNSQQGPVSSSGNSGDRVACFVAVPRHGLKTQGARPTTTPHDTATTSTTIDSPTSSSVALGKRPRKVVLGRKKVVGCACCDFGDHVEHVELGCVDLHVEHDVGMAVGDLQELPDAAENPEAWLLRGDRDLLQLEQWGSGVR